ncbi:lethal(2) giant larvae protein homolog 1-like isoform X1 [Macrosteles quadrilineatus]|uniref:lethal(2) giant larvae protein homolog 1-like isoform X1 n=1 Tax=Macrosteles quadrilineatus TaxID=74068 RepID=UPI0023E0A959|nr:lethal(2) giant larvae protein homolog 1-like isoform X1 [Macrosteles quadrilineatus]
MFKFIRNKGQQPSAERQKLQRDLFAYRRTVQHGFPNKPTCVAWDPELRLMAIGTATGSIKVVGQPGVEFYGHLPTTETAITRLIFIPNEGRLVSLSSTNTLHLWEMNDMTLEDTKSIQLEGKLKKISSLSLDGSTLLLGTEGGNIYSLNTATFSISESIIYQDAVMQNVPEDYKINPGAVECVEPQPGHPGHLLIGYNRGLMVLWNRNTNSALQTYVWAQQLESVCWNAAGTNFMSAHNDGSHTSWDTESGEPRGEPTTPYGPFPCKSITKLIWTQAEGDDLLLYAGGMPRASFSDRHTITAQHAKKHVVFDFTSRVIDFFTIQATGDQKGVSALMVLLEEELVAIDLQSEDWRMLQLPYLVSLHASAVTCATYVSDITPDVYDQIVAAGQAQSKGIYSDAPWPIDGGKLRDSPPTHLDLLLTGHEDGSVRVWRGGTVALAPLYKLTSSSVLVSDDEPVSPVEEEEDEWPPFRKVGAFDPYSDDPRLAVKKLCLCPETGVLVVAGTAGHVLTATLSQTSTTKQVKVTSLNIVSDRDKFVWKGHEKLGVRESVDWGPGYQVESVLQLHPPAAVTALASHTGWGLVAVGTAHGLALYDYQRFVSVTFKCTLNPHDLSGIGDAPISRRKSFKKSLRESFRRLRKGRSGRQGDKRGGQSPTPTDRREKRPVEVVVDSPGTAVTTPTTPAEAKPVERAVEARPVDDALGSMVRCLTFAKTYIISVQSVMPTLWAGTNNGTVYVFTISVPAGNKRSEEAVGCQLGKEIQLKHRAPVIAVSVIDGEYNEVEGRVCDTVPLHRVIITSEEQIKIFTLPSLKPLCKLKLTAGEGARVRRTALARFSTTTHSETCLLCLTNLGDVIVLSLPELRRQINAAVIRREDINGISSLVFTRYGEAVYLHSSSEMQRLSVSATRHTAPHCGLELPPHARATQRLDQGDSSSDSESSSDSSSSSSSSSDSDAEEEKEEKETGQGQVVEIKENGLPETEGTFNHLDLSSVGDITIDSVKDHMVNSTSQEEGSKIVTTEMTKLETTTESVVVKTTVITTNETTLITPTSETPERASTPTIQDGGHMLAEMRKAPLAKMEDLEQLEMAA